MKLSPVFNEHHFKGYWIKQCPGCGAGHLLETARDEEQPATLDVDKPTFWQDFRFKIMTPETTVCAFRINEGQMEFSEESTHELAGKIAPLPDFQLN